MFPILLALHSLTRWLILITLLISLILSYQGWKKNKEFKKSDEYLRILTVSVAHFQLIFGMWLYFISPVVDYFLKNFKESIHNTQLRFFGMEHITMMILALTCITVGSSIARRKKGDKEKFRAIFVWYSIGLFLVLTSIPWEFSPFTARPYFRAF